MGQIKSALEIALEKTKDLKPDFVSMEINSLKQEGKKLTGEFLNNPTEFNLSQAVKKYDKDKVKHVREGAFEVLSARIQLPVTHAADTDDAFVILAKGFAALSPENEKRIDTMFKQLADFIKRYIEDISNMENSIRKQYEPKLKRKEQEYSARTGQIVHIDPMSDPEFVSFYQQNAGKLKAQYQAALDHAKEELAALLGMEIKQNMEE